MVTVPHRRLGTSELEVSELSLGSWHTYDRMTFRDSVELLRRASDAGINLFDIGVYEGPHGPPTFTDVIFGAMVRASGIRRDDFRASVKLWTEGFDDGGFGAQLDYALLRAGIDHADVVILGDIRGELSLEAVVADLGGLITEGKIRQWGVNNWAAPQVRSLLDIAARTGVRPPQVAQLKYSVARRAIGDGDPFGALFAEGLSMQASDVLEGGLLAGRSDTTRQIGRDPGELRPAIIEAGTGMVRLAEKLDCTAAQLGIAFTLTHPSNASTLFGVSSVAQLEQNLGALDLLERVGADELRRLAEPYWVDRNVINPEGP